MRERTTTNLQLTGRDCRLRLPEKLLESYIDEIMELRLKSMKLQ